MADPFRAIRQFERLLFRGVPEHPEPTWQRDSNEHAFYRLTGQSASSGEHSHRGSEEVLIAEIVYDFERKKTKVVRQPVAPEPVPPPESQERD